MLGDETFFDLLIYSFEFSAQPISPQGFILYRKLSWLASYAHEMQYWSKMGWKVNCLHVSFSTCFKSVTLYFLLVTNDHTYLNKRV